MNRSSQLDYASGYLFRKRSIRRRENTVIFIIAIIINSTATNNSNSSNSQCVPVWDFAQSKYRFPYHLHFTLSISVGFSLARIFKWVQTGKINLFYFRFFFVVFFAQWKNEETAQWPMSDKMRGESKRTTTVVKYKQSEKKKSKKFHVVNLCGWTNEREREILCLY